MDAHTWQMILYPFCGEIWSFRWEISQQSAPPYLSLHYRNLHSCSHILPFLIEDIFLCICILKWYSILLHHIISLLILFFSSIFFYLHKTAYARSQWRMKIEKKIYTCVCVRSIWGKLQKFDEQNQRQPNA